MICRQYKCIFIHIPKIAGQSIEHVFLNLTGLNWETRAPLLLRKNDNPKLGPPRLAHLTITEYLKHQYITRENFKKYYKFTFIRNPWCRAVSIYHYLGFDTKYNFNDFILTYYDRLFHLYYWFLKPQNEFLYFENKLFVDFIGRYENIQSDFKKICDDLDIKESALPHKNKSNRQYKNYHNYYNIGAKDKIFKLYYKDIKLFSYEF